MQTNTTNAPPTGSSVHFTSTQAAALNDYWEQLAQNAKGIPTRATFDPIAIPTLLPNIILLERIAKDRYQIRLQGTGFSDRGIPDLTGTILGPNERPPASSLLRNAVERVIDTPCGLHIIGVERNAQGRNMLIEGLGLPLTDETGNARFFVAIVTPLETLDYNETPTHAENLVEIRETTIISLEHLSNPLP